MANYNSITMDEIIDAIESAAIHTNRKQRIRSTRGNEVCVEWQTWRSDDGKYRSLLCVTYDYGQASFPTDKLNRVEVADRILLGLNCYLKVGKEYKRLYKDIIYCNNPRHELFGHIVDMMDGSIIL